MCKLRVHSNPCAAKEIYNPHTGGTRLVPVTYYYYFLVEDDIFITVVDGKMKIEKNGRETIVPRELKEKIEREVEKILERKKPVSWSHGFCYSTVEYKLTQKQHQKIISIVNQVIKGA